MSNDEELEEPATLLARHTYEVASSVDVFDTTSVLVRLSESTGKATMEYFDDVAILIGSPLTTLSHVMSGRGRPLAEQVNVAVFGCTATTS